MWHSVKILHTLPGMQWIYPHVARHHVKNCGPCFPVFRWFKFTLKPPYSIPIGKLRLAIWDTSFWTFWLKFGHKGP